MDTYSESTESTETTLTLKITETKVTGALFNLVYPNINFVKLSNSYDTHYNYKLKYGLNDFTYLPDKQELHGVICFVDEKKAYKFIGECDKSIQYMWKVTIPHDANVSIYKEYFTADKFVLECKYQISKEIYMEAIKHAGHVLYNVPKFMKDREICTKAVKRNSYPLVFVPEALRDKKICLIAVKGKGKTLEYVPDAVKDRDICIAAVKQHGEALKFVPESLKDRELCLEAVKKYGIALAHVPETLKDIEVCFEAVKNNGLSLEYIPEHLKDREMFWDIF